MTRVYSTVLLLPWTIGTSSALQIPGLGGIFKPPAVAVGFPVDQKKAEILQAVSFTSNGKTATPEQQAKVLTLVGDLERSCPVSPTLLSNPEELQALDGTWFLQYTSPSVLGDEDNFPNAWKPGFASEGDANIETTQVKSQGTVTAAGLTVETSNRVVKQIFDVEKGTVVNEVQLHYGVGRAGGAFRQSPNVPNRALVSFDNASITFNNGFVVSFGWVFSILRKLRNSQESGWLETTFLDADMRIGRGNKGTMFVLTRDPEAVKP